MAGKRQRGGSGRGTSGFTLVEIMIVVSVIGLLAAIAIPSYMRARRRAVLTRMASDLRVLEEAFQCYNLEYGAYPAHQSVPGVLPQGMDDYVRTGIFTVARTPCGGRYQWINSDVPVFRYAYIISITDARNWGGPATELDMLQALDEMLDDGVKTTGRIRLYGCMHYHYVVAFK